MKTVLAPKDLCCGCEACALMCPIYAIIMKRDEKGFKYPFVDENKCIHCGVCTKACPLLNKREGQNKIQMAFVGKHGKRNVVLNSTSGGAFTLFSDEILKMKGAIYGVVFDSQKSKARYARATSETVRNEMRGSKYVEAELNSVYKYVKKDLQNNRTVLFVGTPCHVAGLKSYLNGLDCDELFTIDLLCSNVCSSKFLKEWISLLEFLYRKSIEKFSFRDQTRTGWRTQEESFYVGNKKIYMHFYRDLYYSRIFSRPSCDDCVYRKLSREGDISIGDAWGSKTRDSKGTSIILCNTEKGLSFFDRVRKDGNWEEINVYDYLQTGLVPQKYVISKREKIWKHMNKFGLAYVLFADMGADRFISWIKSFKRK